MATNSSMKLREFADAALRRSDLAPQLATAGSSLQPALDIANEVANAMIRGGPDGQRMNWKWNRVNVIPNPLGILSSIGGFGTFLTNAFQQDYAMPGILNVDWLEEAPYININQLQQPKQVLWADPKRNLSKEYISTGTLTWKICFLPNYLLDYGIWGQTAQLQMDGLTCPGPNVVYQVPLGAGVAPNNPVNQIIDPNGNYWVLTQYGTCGSTQPTWTNPVVYPTLVNPSATASTVTDGTCIWTAINPNGQGFRLSCPPAGNSVVWLFRVIAQMIPPLYTSLNQTLGVIPDDMATFFRTGFEAKCIERSPDPKVRAKFHGPDGLWAMWLKALRNAVQQGCREQEDQVLVPDGVRWQAGQFFVANPTYPFATGG